MKEEGNECVLELEFKGERKGSGLGFFCEMVIGEGVMDHQCGGRG